ncbi:SDR family oxidoreductase [Sphaerothrix gracilis]|uniref:SDR family NAD(P)-dependent oxidoreductase n=1 Tax=Sphaerothrix gracilis TaxID=3151835 RepID=UPI0031FCF7E0
MTVYSALITGAAGGIGQALCREFQQAGYHVIGLDLLSTTMPDSCAVKIDADLEAICSNSEYRKKIFAQVRSHLVANPIKVLINNAAIQILKPATALTLDDWNATLNVNLLAPFLLIQAFLSSLTNNKGSIVNIASVHTRLTKPEFACYATSKAALAGLTRSLSVEISDRVRINAIAPAAVATPMLLAGFHDRAEALEQLSKMHPIGHIATPQEVAQAALFLASDQANFITGTMLDLHGGIGNRLYDPA